MHAEFCCTRSPRGPLELTYRTGVEFSTQENCGGPVLFHTRFIKPGRPN